MSGGEGRGRAGADASTGTVMMDQTSSKLAIFERKGIKSVH